MGGIAVLHILTHLFTHWSIRFKAFVSTAVVTSIDDAELVLVVPVKFNGSIELAPLDRKPVVRKNDEALPTSLDA